jgi:type VI secretion system protein ImpC
MPMTDNDAFLRAIRDNPGDDAPRLVYADWLEEQGDPRGEFIHTQIALTRGGNDRPHEVALRRRERELLEHFGDAWARPVTARGVPATFRRGFPEPAEGTGEPPVRPRVRFTYPVQFGSLTVHQELPFVVGVLADLSGHRRKNTLPLRQRHFLTVDRDSFDAVLARVRPQLHLQVPSRLEGRSDPLHLDLEFTRGVDFLPVRLAERIPELRQLLEERRRRLEGAAPAELAALDRQLSAQLAEVLHHPDFQRLEGTWRGLHFLVSRTVTAAGQKVRVLDVTKAELAADLGQAAGPTGSALFEKVHADEYGWRDGEPFGLLVGDFAFDHRPADVDLLQRLATVAALALAPFVAAAAPALFGLNRFTELQNPRALAERFGAEEYAAWRSFRESEESRYVALTLPRVLARLPYGGPVTEEGGVRFEERIDGRGPDGQVWMSAAWAYAACVAAAHARSGWFARTRGVEGGGKVEGLPVHTSPADDGGEAVEGPTAVAISDRREYELSVLGFLPLLYNKDTGNAVFMGAQSCHRPGRPDDARANARAELFAKLAYLQCACSVVRPLKVLAGDLLRSSVPLQECRRRLGEWLRGYTLGEEAMAGWFEADDASVARRPVASTSVQLRALPDQPGAYGLAVSLWPVFELETLTVEMELVTRVGGPGREGPDSRPAAE